MGKQIFFYSNSTKTREEVSKKLKGLGIQAPRENIYTASYVMAYYISNFHPYMRKVCCIGTEGLYKELKEVGLTLIEGSLFNHNIVEWNFLNEYDLDKDIGAVVIGFDAEFNYLKLAVAGLLLSRPECMFLTTNDDIYDLIDGVKHPDTGAFVASVQDFIGRDPDATVGKPNPLAFSIIQKLRPEIIPERTCMVGDRLDTDIAFARKSGLQKMLTFSGVIRPNELENLLPTDIDYFIHCIGDIYKIIKA
jgi:phosphoglycolate/pyridoxal phosphate phosphatase family enzyme